MSMDFLVTEFIDLVRERRAIWDQLHPDQGRNEVFSTAFTDILDTLRNKYSWCPDALAKAKLDSLENMKAKWHSLRSNFLAKENSPLRRGPHQAQQRPRRLSNRTFKWQNELSFLVRDRVDLKRSLPATSGNSNGGHEVDGAVHQAMSSDFSDQGELLEGDLPMSDHPMLELRDSDPLFAEELEVKPEVIVTVVNGKDPCQFPRDHRIGRKRTPSRSSPTPPKVRRFGQTGTDVDHDHHHRVSCCHGRPPSWMMPNLDEDEAFCTLIYTQIENLDQKSKRGVRMAILNVLDKANNDQELMASEQDLLNDRNDQDVAYDGNDH